MTRAVSGVTCHWFGFGMLRHRSTCWRVHDRCVFILLFSVEMSFPSPNKQEEPFRFFGFGMGVMNCGALRRSMIV